MHEHILTPCPNSLNMPILNLTSNMKSADLFSGNGIFWFLNLNNNFIIFGQIFFYKFFFYVKKEFSFFLAKIQAQLDKGETGVQCHGGGLIKDRQIFFLGNFFLNKTSKYWKYVFLTRHARQVIKSSPSQTRLEKK